MLQSFLIFSRPMLLFIKYLTNGLSITIMSWIVGMTVNALLMKNKNYHTLSNLNFIKSESLNKMIGLGPFKWIVKNTFFKFFNDKIKIENNHKNPDWDELRNQMTYSEISHLVGFIFVLFFIGAKVIKGEFLFAFIILIVNTLMNLYPSLLQQQNKRRIDRLRRRYG